MKNFGIFYIELVAFVILGVVNTATRFGYIQMNHYDQAGMWVIFFGVSGLILIQLLIVLMESQKQSRSRHKLELLLDDILLQIRREDDAAQLRILSQGITTIQEDPSAYENYLHGLKNDVKAMIRNLCDVHNQQNQRNFRRGLGTASNGKESQATYRSDVFIKEGEKIAALETISAACKSTS